MSMEVYCSALNINQVGVLQVYCAIFNQLFLLDFKVQYTCNTPAKNFNEYNRVIRMYYAGNTLVIHFRLNSKCV